MGHVLSIDEMNKVAMDVGLNRPTSGYTAAMRAYRVKFERDFSAARAKNPKLMIWIPE
jgi:hypothetical protein